MDAKFTPDYLLKADAWATQLGLEAAEKLAKADYLKELGKDILSSIMTDLEGSEKISESKLERLARKSEKWFEFRKGQLAAQEEAIVAKARAANAERHFHSIQSGLSYRKEELRRIDGERVS